MLSARVSAGELFLDGVLVCAEPVEGGVELVFIDGSELEGLAEGGECGFGVEGACGGEFGGGVEDAVRDHGGDEVAGSGGFSFEEGVEAEFVEGSEDGGDVSVGEGSGRCRLPCGWGYRRGLRL